MKRETFTNPQIASLLRKVAAAYELKRGNRFKIMAYQRAADAVEHATSELKDLWDDNKLSSVSGIGANIAGHLDELFRKGKVRHFEEVTAGLPKSMFPLLGISGFGPKTAYKLVTTFKIKNHLSVVEELIKLAENHKIADLPGFGEKSERIILENLYEFQRKRAKLPRILLPQAFEAAEKLISYLKNSPYVIRADPLGSLRRMVSTVGDIDIAVVTDKNKEVIEHFTSYPEVKKVIEAGSMTSTVVLKNGFQVDLMVQPAESYGALLQHFTGSKHHNIHLREIALSKGISLSEYGIKIKGKIYPYPTEEKFYQALGMNWIPPELREDSGEIEASLGQRLPKLVKSSDIKGDLHLHSNFNIEPSHDLGSDSIEVTIEEGQSLGYQYIGFAEHNPSISQHTENEIIDLIKRRNEAIDKVSYSRGKPVKSRAIKILKLLEVDILADGRLAVPNGGLKLLDGAIAAIHSAFNQSKEKMTQRVLTALENPQIRILAHPTGRILNQREGYELDWEKIFEFCRRHHKALEINAWPTRLDLPDILVREAIKNGVKLMINTDAHAVEELKLMRFGVAVARRGWAGKDDIVNTLGYNDFVKWLRERG
jgi:DNA polymerase (family 10)